MHNLQVQRNYSFVIACKIKDLVSRQAEHQYAYHHSEVSHEPI